MTPPPPEDAAAQPTQAPPTTAPANAALAQRYEAEIAAIEDDLLGEIEQTQTAAAARERALIAERDAYKAQLDVATSTKAWRASQAYWRARARGPLGVFGLLGQLATYLARVGYHICIPYPLRRDLWYRRHTGRSYRSYFQLLGASQASATPSAPPADAASPAEIQKALGPDVICFAALDWEASSARGRLLSQTFASAGHRSYWLAPALAPARDRIAATHLLSGDITEISLPGDGGDITARPIFRRSALRRALTALRSYCNEHDVRDALCVVQHPAWAPLVEELQRRYGWKVIYDLADGDEPDARLRSACDLIVTTAPAQRERLRGVDGVDGVDGVALIPAGAAYTALMDEIRRLYGRATVLIVTYRSFDKTRLTLKSVLEKTRYPHYEILIVDNGSQPDIQRYVRDLAQRFPETVRFIFNDGNLGFAGGNNVGLRATKDSAYVVLLNDDVIVTPGWLGALVRYLGDRSIGLVGPVTNSCGNEARIPIDYSAPDEADAFARRYTFAHEGESFDIAVLAMYCVALRQDTLAELGELDERFRYGMFEDDDYAVRVRQAGYRVVCAEDSYVHHFGSSSFGKMSEEAYTQLFEANRRLFEEKWATKWLPHKYRER